MSPIRQQDVLHSGPTHRSDWIVDAEGNPDRWGKMVVLNDEPCGCEPEPPIAIGTRLRDAAVDPLPGDVEPGPEWVGDERGA